MRVLAETFEMGGCYDQLNLGSLASFELLARRWQLIMEAHSADASKPSYDASDYFGGTLKKKFAIAPTLTSHVATLMKDDAEIEKQRTKVRDLRGPARPQAKGQGAPKKDP